MDTGQLIQMILKSEDPKNPLTDHEIAQRLGSSRELVTRFRKIKGIPDSRERRKTLVIQEIMDLINKEYSISERKLTQLLNDHGYHVTRSVVSGYRREAELLLDETNKNVSKVGRIPNQESHRTAFSKMIGYDGSLKEQVGQAKAAVIYPPYGLNTLILGPSGAGKSFLAELMHQFAVETQSFAENAPFMTFNCADYANNPQLLLAQLFGYQKGAFTGANEDKKGIVELCNKGILFLDEIHRLPAEGQEILFYLLDKGKFRRLGESALTRSARIMLIGATTEDPNKALLLTFRRRIPMMIELPKFAARPISERFALIKMFFTAEAKRLGNVLVIKSEVLRSLLSYSCPGNIGQLQSDIKVSCARAFLHSAISQEKRILVNFQNMPDYVRDEILTSDKGIDPELSAFIYNDLVLSEKTQVEKNKQNDLLQNNIYQFIDDTYSEMKLDGYSDEKINLVIGTLIEKKLERVAMEARANTLNLDTVTNIIGKNIYELACRGYKLAKKELPYLQDKIIAPLAIHLSSTYGRTLNHQEIHNPSLHHVKQKYMVEYHIAKKIVVLINRTLDVHLNEDEVSFIAMYLKNFQTTHREREKHVAVIVLSHGHVACGMADVANRLLGVNHAVGLEMDLSDSPNLMLEKTIQLVRKVNQGKGCLLLADMGSLVIFGDIIHERTSIPVRVIGRVDTLMVIECVRRALLPEDSLERIADELDSKNYYYNLGEPAEKSQGKVIVTLCITGKGAAQKIKNYLYDSLGIELKNIEVIPVGYTTSKDIHATIEQVVRGRKIVAIVGTIDPEYENTPFITAEELLTGDALVRLRNMLNNKVMIKAFEKLSDVIDPNLIYFESGYKDDIIDRMCQNLVDHQKVDANYLLSVYKREAQGNTYLDGGLAIPHGEGRYVTKPTISITKLTEPILWDGKHPVDMVFLLALNIKSKGYFEQLFRLLSDSEVIRQLRAAQSNEELYQMLIKSTK